MPFEESELRKFSEAGRVIAAAVGASVETWARAEAGVVLKTWAGRTQVATDKSVSRRAILRAYREARGLAFGLKKGETPPGTATINLGFRTGNADRVWYRTRKNKKFQMVYGASFSAGWHIRRADWPPVERMVHIYRHQVKLMIEAAKKAAGLARQSIVQIADDLGIRLEEVKGGGTLSAAGLAKARSALASNGQFYRNGYATTSRTAREFYLTLINRYPRLGAIGMDATLQGVIAGRLKFFERNLEEGVFLSAKETAQKYPYLEVLRAA